MSERVLSLCADDFGQSASVSSGIAELVQQGRLTAVSCITNTAPWRTGAARLQHTPDTVDVGLHFNLTEGQPLSAELARVWPRMPSLPKLLLLSHLGRLPLPALRCEWQAQLGAFTDTLGRAPQMIDGHQHVHHLPGVREVLLEGIGGMATKPAVRNTGRLVGPGFAFKRRVIEGTGGTALQQELQRRGMPYNPSLLGVYDFAAPDYRVLMQAWLSALPPEGGLLFCHPGETAGAGEHDAIAAARTRELAYLRGDDFPRDLAQAGVVLGRVWTRGKAFSETSRPG